MDPGEWATAVGILFTTGGFLWCRAYETGGTKKKLKQISDTIP
jgi:hypothetical protein